MALVDTARLPQPGWLRSREFDLALTCGLTVMALAAGGLIAMAPASIVFIMLFDTWVLGSPHVVATLFRLAPDAAGLRQHRFLIFVLPFIVLAAVTGIALSVGIVLVATIYFFWQWYHTLRQSWGVAQLYRRRSSVPVGDHPLFAEGLFTLVALWGLLHRLTTAPEYFLIPSLPIIVPHVPVWFADGVGLIAVSGLAWWCVMRFREWIAGELPLAHTLFSASHFVIFIVGYVVMDDIVGGWLVTNIWHTSQYLMLVWAFNQNAAAKPESAEGWFFQATRGNKAPLYFGLCFFGALLLYSGIFYAFLLGATGIMIAIIANQTLNFHHFIVDAVIWRARRKPAGAPA
jgi:hypothetical protein